LCWETTCNCKHHQAWMRDEYGCRKKPLATQAARQRQIRSSAASLFTLSPSLFFSCSVLFCSALVGYWFFCRFFFGSLLYPLYEEEEDDDETRNQFPALQCHPCIADLQCLCPLSLCLQLQVGGRAFVAEHKQNKGSLSLLSRARPRDKGSVCAPCDAKQGPFLLLRGSINKNNPLTSTFLLMSSRSTAQVIFTCPPPQQALALLKLPWFRGFRCWTVAADFLQANETAVATQRPLPLGLAQAAAHHAAATSAAASLLYPLLYCTELNWTEKEKKNKIASDSQFKNSAMWSTCEEESY